MYIFLLQNDRHKNTNNGYGLRSLRTTRGQFHLNKLRKFIKDKHEIVSHGDSRVQKVASYMGCGDIIAGHMLYIHDDKKALWARLNIENLTKGLELKSMYRGFDDAVLDEFETRYAEAHARFKETSIQLSTLHFYAMRTRDFARTCEMNQESFCKDLFAPTQELYLKVEDVRLKLQQEKERRQTELKKIVDEFKSYVESCKA